MTVGRGAGGATAAGASVAAGLVAGAVELAAGADAGSGLGAAAGVAGAGGAHSEPTLVPSVVAGKPVGRYPQTLLLSARFLQH